MDDATLLPPETRTELLDRSASHAESVPLDVDHARIDWELSERAKRRAGACLYDRDTGRVTIRLTWAAYRAYGWASFSGVVRHEVIHAWEYQRFGESDHGDRFRTLADELDAPLRCPAFATPRLRLACTHEVCSWTLGRHRASAVVTRPGRRRCGACGRRYVVEHVETGATWTTHRGYERARARIGDRW
jgi:predicted SprT family Zn-dependent metalloprotease